jgi:hypothetical protein
MRAGYARVRKIGLFATRINALQCNTAMQS